MRASSVTARFGLRNTRMPRRAFRYAAIAVVVVALFSIAHGFILREIASFLIIEDPLQPAQMIVAMAGQTPFREMEAAKLYREGWAPRLLLVRNAPNEEARALRTLGIIVDEGWEISRQVLIKLGVPASAIIIAESRGGGTLEEMEVVAAALRDKEAPVIIVTSKYHLRRAHLTWNYVTGNRSRGIFHAAARDSFDPARWWRERSFVLAVVREYLGLINYYAGFPVGVAGN